MQANTDVVMMGGDVDENQETGCSRVGGYRNRQGRRYKVLRSTGVSGLGQMRRDSIPIRKRASDVPVRADGTASNKCSRFTFARCETPILAHPKGASYRFGSEGSEARRID